MFRRSLPFISAVSLLLCVALSVLWVRSYRMEDGLFFYRTHWSSRPAGESNTWYTRDTSSAGIFWDRGILLVAHLREMKASLDVDTVASDRRSNPEGNRLRLWHRPAQGRWRGIRAGHGFIIVVLSGGQPRRRVYVSIPFWAAFALTLIFPAISLRRWIGWLLRRRAPAAGLCMRCGYDLRATPDRCPECGKLVSSIQPTDM